MQNVNQFKMRHAGRLDAAADLINATADVLDNPAAVQYLDEALRLVRDAARILAREATNTNTGE